MTRDDDASTRFFYSARAGTTKRFHLAVPVPGSVIPAMHCGVRVVNPIVSVEAPGHLEICDDCVLADSFEPSVYRFFDADDVLLYLGCTGNILRRFGQHAHPRSKSRAWWPRQRRHTIDTYATKAEAFAVETAAIKAEKPLYPLPPAKPVRRLRPFTPDELAEFWALMAAEATAGTADLARETCEVAA